MTLPSRPTRPPRHADVRVTTIGCRRQAPDAARRHTLWLVAGLALAGITACSTTSPPAAPTAGAGSRWSDAQQQGLRALNFEPQGDDWALSLSSSLLFEFDADRLQAEQRSRLMDLGRQLQALAVPRLRVEGHTDGQGEAAYNRQLSLRRAQTVAQALAAAGWASELLQVSGFGRERPIADNGSEAGRAQNRRVVLIVSGG